LNNVVELNDIGMKYQSLNGEIPALEHINLKVRQGEFVSIVGPDSFRIIAPYIRQRFCRE